MREICVADSETDPFEHGADILPFIWGWTNGSEYREFSSTDEFMEFICERDCIVYAHNGGRFDWHFLLEWLEPDTRVMVISGRLAKFKIGKAEFRDSYNILPVPLSAYKKDEIDYTMFRRGIRDLPENMRKIREYLRSDCMYLFEFVSQFIQRYGQNLTFAGAAMKVWQKIQKIDAPETNRDFYKTFEPFYYGGRVQAFHIGRIHTPFKVIDINSAYPFAMKHRHPWGEGYTDGAVLKSGETERMFMTIECPSKGAFPFRADDGSLDFPDDGKVRTFHITGWEFLAAQATGSLPYYSIKRLISFPLSIQFDPYIDHFFAEKSAAKLAGDAAGYQFAKFFLNGLYGKFAANPEKYREFKIVDPTHIYGAQHEGYEFSAPLGPWALVERELPDERQRYYNLAVGASITGFVRAYLWRAMKQCTGVLYCDTDSIACAGTGSLDLDPARLGAWDVEANCIGGGIAGKKLYAFQKEDGKYKIASKGARLTADELLRVADGEVVKYNSEAPTFSVHTGRRYISRNVKRKDVAKPKKRA